MKINKCDYGYANSHRVKIIIKTVCWLLIAGFCFYMGFNTTGVPMYMFKVFGVLDLIPFANAAVEMIMSFRGIKHKCQPELHEEIADKSVDGKPYLRYDLFITSYDKCFPLQSLTCFDGSLVAYSEYEKFDHGKFEEHVNTMLANNLLKVGMIKVFTDKKKYLDRISSFAESSNEISENDYKVMRLMENLSI